MTIAHEDRSGIEAAEQPCTYVWDQETYRNYCSADDEAINERLARLTGKASLGLAIASAAWMVRRFSTYALPIEMTQYLAATWAGAVHEAYCEYTEWQYYDLQHGPVQSPVRLGFAILNDALHDMGADPNPAREAGLMGKLVRHVCPDPRPFDDWWEACVSRLERFHAIDVELAGRKPDLFENFPNMGSPVPPQAYDPRHPYDPTHNAELWDRYLQGLDPTSNPFLRSVEDLEYFGELPAPPYRYALSAKP